MGSEVEGSYSQHRIDRELNHLESLGRNSAGTVIDPEELQI